MRLRTALPAAGLFLLALAAPALAQKTDVIVLFNGDRVTCVTDWEFAHLGDPIEDWVYMATMRGARHFTRERWAEIFAEEAGVSITPDEWTFWDAFNHFKGACANITTLRAFSSGANPAPNMAAIGTGLHLVFLQRLAEIVGANP